MHRVRIRLNASEFAAGMTEIGEWLDAHRYESERYKYDHHEDAIVVTVDFPTEPAAKAFAARFDGVSVSHSEAIGRAP
jgi:hypothetical protein